MACIALEVAVGVEVNLAMMAKRQMGGGGGQYEGDDERNGGIKVGRERS